MKLLRLVMILALAFSAGCIKLTQTLTLEADGSGTIEIDYSIPEETVTQVSGMIKLATELAKASGEPAPHDEHSYLGLLLNPSENRIRQKVTSYKIDGLALKEVKVESRDGSRDVNMLLSFQRITDLAQTDFFAEQGFALTRLPNGKHYRLTRKGAGAPAESPVDLNDPDVVRMLSPVLGGFEATVGVKTPGNILQANTTRRSRRQAVWNFDFNRDPKAFRDFYGKQLIVVFDGVGLSLPAE
ncbi:MAG: hypothetical protein HN919_02260 [Verrucomicrobia bacterium]|mgnify:CR=1 FL=1|jgi:hypothetical protein|nr:hypothetical protein [Verrucomicrobiota bacterium]MBT7065099.1 hypothetical protein [Verrucomicrobiota bacterium]MBT7701677.1 hypothetical protein [Verrucomicrobiota bacterium]